MKNIIKKLLAIDKQKHFIAGFLLEQIGIENVEKVLGVINSLSHKNIYKYQFNKMSEAEEDIFKDVFQKIQNKYHFVF